jgi:hypothetical protein
MRRSALVFAFAACFAGGCNKLFSGADKTVLPTSIPTYNLNLKSPGAGDVTAVTGSNAIRMKMRVVTADGVRVLAEQPRVESESYSYKDTVLERPEGSKRATKIRRKYDNASWVLNGKLQRRLYHNETVLIEKTGAKYAFKIESGIPLTGDDLKKLELEFDPRLADLAFREMIPKKEAQSGEKWKLDVKKIVTKFEAVYPEMVFDHEMCEGNAKLAKTTTKDGREYGTFDLELDLGLKAVRHEGKRYPLDNSSNMNMKVTFVACIDGSIVDEDANFTLEIDVGAKGPNNLRLEVVGHSEGRQTEREVVAAAKKE